MHIYLLLIIPNILFANSIKNCLLDNCDNDGELLMNLMKFITKNQKLSAHVVDIKERLLNLELQNVKYEEKINQLEEQCKIKINRQSCVNRTDSSWIVIQRRKDGSVDFYRNWKDYKNGFGDKMGEFFIGLETLHKLTDNDIVPYELLITMETFEGRKYSASYDDFIVGGESENYKLKSLGKYKGDAGECLNYHLQQEFSTIDRKNDQNPSQDCAKTYEGGWWYNECHYSNLNGRYDYIKDDPRPYGIHWYKVTGYNTSLKFVEMKIRPKICQNT